jgi:50S ribosomal protein uL3/50S ribosomal protein L4
MTRTVVTQSYGSSIKGVLGKKLGMTQVFDANNKMIPVTVVSVESCVVTSIRTPEKDGYSAVQLGFGAIDPKKVSKPLAGHYAKSGVTPRRSVAELRTLSAAEYTVGQEIGASTFAPGDIVDATGTSTGKGTAGVMKRHGFGGLGSSHGVDRKHRMPGSIGACSTPGRVFKGMRMMGRMGNEKITTQNLTVQGVDIERNLLLIKGSVPGTDGGLQEGNCRNCKGWYVTMALTLEVKNAEGKKVGSVDLPADLFDAQTNIPLIHQVVTAQLAAARQGTQKAKNRGETSGSGKKPFKQKGTGRARQGSIRAPLQRGGGAAHAVRPRSYFQRTPKKMIAAALTGVLSDRQRNERIHVLDSVTAAPSTKAALAAVRQFSTRKHLLVVISRKEDAAWRSLRNADDLHLLVPDQLNAYDILKSDDVVFSEAAFNDFLKFKGTAKASGKSVKSVARESEVSA